MHLDDDDDDDDITVDGAPPRGMRPVPTNHGHKTNPNYLAIPSVTTARSGGGLAPLTDDQSERVTIQTLDLTGRTGEWRGGTLSA